MHARVLALVLTVAACSATPLASLGAVATPEPGGANQSKGVSGTLSSTLFNGQVRIKKMVLDKPNGSSGESYTDDADHVWLAFRAVMSNGTQKSLDMEQFSATIVDADGIGIAAAPDRLRPMGSINGIPPGGAWKEVIIFQVPRDFVPARIVLAPYADTRYKVFRIKLTSSAPASGGATPPSGGATPPSGGATPSAAATPKGDD